MFLIVILKSKIQQSCGQIIRLLTLVYDLIMVIFLPNVLTKN